MEVADSATRHPSLFTFHARPGQVALYLVAVLVAICVLTLMNVGIYLSVSAKNKVMNAGDAASVAVANYQGELLNRIGQMNIEHLKAALEDDEKECEKIATGQLRMCFLGPISGTDGGNARYPYGGISAGNELARNNGAERLKDVEKLLRQHAQDVRQYYVGNPEVYPEPWEGAWGEYAMALEMAVNAGIWAGPDNINFIDAASGHMLLERQFYNAIAGRNWCWFKFNAADLLGSYGGFLSWGPLPSANDATRWRRRVNSEVYSLNLQLRIGSAVDLLGTNLICRLTGATEKEVAQSGMIADPEQQWLFYDENVWRNWWEIDPYGVWRFPVVGQVRPEYNVRGCAALCRTYAYGANLIGDEADNVFGWTGGAKPFGTVENEDGKTDIVTANRGFVTPAFDQARLVPIDSVGGKDLSTADADWMWHVRDHLPLYVKNGPTAVTLKGCWYCRQLVTWERASFRQTGVRWLKYHSKECVRPTCCGGNWQGGTPHGH